jgi:hypothetical protein
MPHVIRLRGPWEYEPLVRFVPVADGRLQSADDSLPAPGITTLPDNWGTVLGSDFQGTVRFTRRFNCPTGLGAGSRVWLVVDDVDWHATIVLNGQLLGAAVCSFAAHSVSEQSFLTCGARFDITTDLLPQNVLAITVASPILNSIGNPQARPGRAGQPGGLIGLVRLEIED